MRGFLQSKGFMSSAKGFQQGRGFLHPVKGFQLGTLLNPDYAYIGNQRWVKSIAVDTVSALGFVIPNVTDNTIFASSITLYNNAYTAQSGTVEQKIYAGVKAAAMWCYYNNDASIGAWAGRMVNGYGILLLHMDINYYNIANPSNKLKLRIGNLMDYQVLNSYLVANAGGKLKEIGLDHWLTPNTGATDQYKFGAVGGGQRQTTGTFSAGSFKTSAKYWAVDNYDNLRLYFMSLGNADALVTINNDLLERGMYCRYIVAEPKLTTLGDSITRQEKWQLAILKAKKFTYVSNETTLGTLGRKAMGVSSSRVVPLIDAGVVGQQSGNSIYERADSVHLYSPDNIILAGGTNDMTFGNVGTMADEAYTGAAVSENPPTFIAAYKGTLDKLIANNPNKRIVCVTPLFTTAVTVEVIQSFVTAILEIASAYGLTGIDLLNGVPINASNHATYLQDGVHPNDLGGTMIGEYIASQM
jgi:lysophospholipase L1-like esterase